jgi:peroxiredoxin
MVINSYQSSALCAAVLMAFSLSAPKSIAQTANGKLQPPEERKIARELALEDSDGKKANLKEYRGKVVVLNFWTTWCHGCKEEIPWFAEFQRQYGEQGLNVVGVSLDDDGWKVVKPFIQAMSVPYRIVLGNQPTAKAYAIEQMPHTFLIDRQGRVAATYVGMVDRNGIEKNIQQLLAQK